MVAVVGGGRGFGLVLKGCWCATRSCVWVDELFKAFCVPGGPRRMKRCAIKRKGKCLSSGPAIIIKNRQENAVSWPPFKPSCTRHDCQPAGPGLTARWNAQTPGSCLASGPWVGDPGRVQWLPRVPLAAKSWRARTGTGTLPACLETRPLMSLY